LLANYRVYGVFDESVQIKNFKSVRWKRISKWHNSFAYVRLLTGRPMVLSPMDLWSQMTILKGQISTSPYAFRNTYCRMGGWMNKVVIGVINGEQLTERLAAISWTATKRQWTDLPEKLYTTRNYELTSVQKQLYKKMFNDMLVEIADKPISVNQAVHKYSKLQQIGSGMMIDEQGEATPIMEFKEVPKVQLLDEILEGVSGKIIVFAHYRASVEALSAYYACPTLRGGMSEDEISRVVNEFNNGDSRVLIAQVAAAKYGLTLLGNDKLLCHTTVYFENTYQLDARIQSEDRNHRHGQHNAVLYIDLVGTPVDAKIIRSLQTKDDLSKTILGIKDMKNGN
jgi:SNF2 family DNA or RNA helicase